MPYYPLGLYYRQSAYRANLSGVLHGIPVLLKDNIDTADRMMTTAGSLALVGAKPPKDSYVAQKLRAAGALILAKSNPSEWANIRSSHSTSGWSGRGGLTKNPYALDRNPCGSSSGSGAGVSANICTVAIGTVRSGTAASGRLRRITASPRSLVPAARQDDQVHVIAGQLASCQVAHRQHSPVSQ